MVNKNINQINASIEKSHEVLESAWKNHTPQISENLKVLGKPVGDRSLRKQWQVSTDVTWTNVLKRFKQFWGGSYLTRFRSGEIIFADLSYFRSLFLPTVYNDEIALEQAFFRVNDLWFQAQKAFFAREMTKFNELLLSLTQEIFLLRRLLSVRESASRESRFKSVINRIRAQFKAR